MLSVNVPVGVAGNFPLIVTLGLNRDIDRKLCPNYHHLIEDIEDPPALVQTMGNSTTAWNIATLNKITRKLYDYEKSPLEKIISIKEDIN